MIYVTQTCTFPHFLTESNYPQAQQQLLLFLVAPLGLPPVVAPPVPEFAGLLKAGLSLMAPEAPPIVSGITI